MITTPDLIDLLAANARPVRRLRRPFVRAGLWLALALAVVGVLALGQGLRPDFALRMQEPAFIVGIAASLGTGILAVLVAFIVSLPDRSRRWLLLPVPTLLLWVSTIGYGCLNNWIEIGPDGVTLGETARCFATLLVVSVPLALALYVMLRRSMLLRPAAVALAASLAVAAITATALSLFHPLDASAMILLWNIGVAAVLVLFGSMLGTRAGDAMDPVRTF